MLAYDLVGFQTEEDCENFLSYAQSDLGLVVHDGVVISQHGRTRAEVFPIGIDPQKFAQLAARAVTHPDVSRLRRSLNGEALAIGVDRLDYSKGLINRIKAFDRMWTLQPSLARTASLLQIATPSRGAIEAYGNLQNEVAKLVSDVNGPTARSTGRRSVISTRASARHGAGGFSIVPPRSASSRRCMTA